MPKVMQLVSGELGSSLCQSTCTHVQRAVWFYARSQTALASRLAGWFCPVLAQGTWRPLEAELSQEGVEQGETTPRLLPSSAEQQSQY